MRLSNFRIPAAIVGLALLAGTVAVPANARPAALQTQTSSNGAIPGGNEPDGTIQYVCGAPYNGGLHPGKTVAGNCNIGWGGKEIVISIPPAGYEIASFPVVWVSSSNGQSLPANAVQAGYEANGTPLYSCRASYNGGVHLGKTVAGNCNIGWGGKEIVLRNYQVLVAR